MRILQWGQDHAPEGLDVLIEMRRRVVSHFFENEESQNALVFILRGLKNPKRIRNGRFDEIRKIGVAYPKKMPQRLRPSIPQDNPTVANGSSMESE